LTPNPPLQRDASPASRLRAPELARYASPNPSPLSSYEVVANRLCAAPRTALPHRSTTARIFLVEPKASGPQTGPALLWQGVGVNRLMPHRPSCPPRRPVEHRAGVPCAVRAKARYLCRLAIVKPRRYRATNNRNPAQGAALVGHANREPMPHHRPTVAVQVPHKLVGGFEVSWHDAERHNPPINPDLRQKPAKAGYLARWA